MAKKVPSVDTVNHARDPLSNTVEFWNPINPIVSAAKAVAHELKPRGLDDAIKRGEAKARYDREHPNPAPRRGPR